MSSSVGDFIHHIFGKLTVQDKPETGNTELQSDEESEGDSDPDAAPLIKFARFVGGTLQLFEGRTDSTNYIAFSHCWGDWSWRSIPGIPYEVKASQEKADFIANDLPALVGDGIFWMDTLTVDQTKETEVLAIVDAIPTIFKHASKTIAVRECDGLYDCCVEVVEGFDDYGDFAKKLYSHVNEHDEYLCAESYLQRLWTLQECLLSHTIEFVVGKNSRSVRSKPQNNFVDNKNQTSLKRRQFVCWKTTSASTDTKMTR